MVVVSKMVTSLRSHLLAKLLRRKTSSLSKESYQILGIAEVAAMEICRIDRSVA